MTPPQDPAPASATPAPGAPATPTTDATPSSSGMFSRTDAANDGSFAPQDWALFLGISLIWGASFLLMAEALEALTPGMVTLGRVGFGAVTLGVLRLLLHRGERIAPEDRWRVVALAVLWVALPFSLIPLAQQWINSAVAGLLNGATPVLVTVVSVVLVRNAPRPLQVVGLIVGFVGIVLVSLGSAAEGSSQAQGVVLVLAATVCYGFAINMAPPLQAKYGAVVLMSSVLAVATALVIPTALINLGDNRVEPVPTLAVFAVGALGTGAAYWIFSTLVGRVGSIRASFITYLIPVVSLLLGIWLRDDEVTRLALIGAPITIAGAVLASRRS
ncbi:MAG: DMT family transporter [Actinomycetota bacterium]